MVCALHTSAAESSPRWSVAKPRGTTGEYAATMAAAPPFRTFAARASIKYGDILHGGHLVFQLRPSHASVPSCKQPQAGAASPGCIRIESHEPAVIAQKVSKANLRRKVVAACQGHQRHQSWSSHGADSTCLQPMVGERVPEQTQLRLISKLC